MCVTPWLAKALSKHSVEDTLKAIFCRLAREAFRSHIYTEKLLPAENEVEIPLLCII